MKQLKYFISASLLVCSLIVAHAASPDSITIKRDVTVQKDYVPTIQDAGKINEIPSIVDPEIKQIDVTYSPYSILLDPNYQIRQLESARLKSPPLITRKEGLLRLGLGNKWSTLGDFMYPLLNKPGYRLDINLNHRGIFSDEMHHQNKGGLSYRHYTKNGEFSMDGSYGFEGFNYYGENLILTKYANTTFLNEIGSSFLGSDYLPEIAKISTWDMSIGYNTLPTNKEYSLNIKLNYDGFSPTQGLMEHLIKTKIYYDKNIDENKAGIDVQLQNLVYNTDNVQNYYAQPNYSVFTLNPFFAFKQSNWSLRLGVSTNFSKDAEGKGFAPTADIEGQATLVDKSIYAYGGITGDYQVNSMNYMESLNRYMNLNKKIKDTYTPFDVYGGLKLKLLYNFLIDMSVRHKTIKNQYFFVNDILTNTAINSTQFANNFGVVYHDANLFNAALRINYNYNQVFSFILAAKYNNWKLPDGVEAWYLPKYEFDFGTDMKLTKRTSVNIYTYVATGRKTLALDGSIESMKAIADINLGFFYAHSSKVSSFLKLNNLLNSHYENWNGYEVIGFNAMLGLTFSF